MKAASVVETIGGTTPADYFAHIPTVTFKGPDTDDELAYRFCDKIRIVRQRAFHLAVLQGDPLSTLGLWKRQARSRARDRVRTGRDVGIFFFV